MAEKLTPEQQEAVTNRGGALLVSAAAGSGKTKVLVDRLMGYLTDPREPANLDDFLLITYTRAAAGELRGKIADKLAQRIAQEPENRHLQRQMQRLYLAKISTVHGFCTDLLREYAWRLEIPADFRVADENECRQMRTEVLEQVLEQAYAQMGEDPDFCAFVDSQGLGRKDDAVPEILEQVYNSARCHTDPDGWLEQCLQAATGTWTGAEQTVWGRYLMESLRHWLTLQIDAMTQCAELAKTIPKGEKTAANLWETIAGLQRFRESRTWDEVLQRREISFRNLTFPRGQSDSEKALRIKAVREKCKKGLEYWQKVFSEPSAVVLADLSQSADAQRGLVRLVRAFDRAYSDRKRRARALDFGDLEQRALDLLLGTSRSGPTGIAREVGARFREVLVDEYQDSNGVQDAIFSALTREKQNLFLVGDVKQSIYQFRLADPGIFLEKYQCFVPAAEAAPRQGRKVLLSSNFRSGGAVLEAVNDVFRVCMSPAVGGLVYGDGEALREGIPRAPLGEPEVALHVLQTGGVRATEAEAAFVANEIAALLEGGHLVRGEDGLRPVRPEDIVILLRSPGTVAAAFQRALAAKKIAVTSGGGEDLLKMPEVQILHSLLQTIANPRQDIPLLAVLASPLFGFTANEIAGFRAGKKELSVYDSLLQGKTEKIRHFLELLAELRRTAERRRLPELLEAVLEATRFDSLCAAGTAGEREHLQAFCQTVSTFDAGGSHDLGDFLDYLTALGEKGLILAPDGGSGSSVTIMSIHKSKGLEFPVVFLCGLARTFNREGQRKPVLCDRELGMGMQAVDARTRVRCPTIAHRAIAAKGEDESLSEELRVLYVAMTRARDRLIMTYASRNAASTMSTLAARLGTGAEELLSRDATCLGDWVLQTALRRTEAGALFAVAGQPEHTAVSQRPWEITWRTVSDVLDAMPETFAEAAVAIPEETVALLRQSLSFRYPYAAATRTPSKQTATQRKGREKDQEAAEYARVPDREAFTWRRPTFCGGTPAGTVYGSAVHAVLQYIRYEACTDEAGVQAEVRRMTEKGILTPEQEQMVNCRKIAGFFRTEPGKKLRAGVRAIREFKFSILTDAAEFGPGLEEEQILLQGVVDCAILEEDGITVIDFKTDHVTEETLPAVAARYRPQVEVYAQALERIYEIPVKERLLYFFHMDRFERV